ncbi:hypothetical protein EVA_06118 [gut metagenome]|uniref:DUF4368 domain-containing protein n=1 Tax=gut metagenome TaxID=749906 RepID=J9GSV7_9ZZZZ
MEKFIRKATQYRDLDSLTPDALRDMVSAIYVSAPDKSSGKRHRKSKSITMVQVLSR